MQLISTRDNHTPVSAAEAIRLGMVPGGGLFVPEAFPSYLPADLVGKPYGELAEEIFSLYLTDYSQAEIAGMVKNAYLSGNFPANPAPVVRAGNDYLLELWHGPTAAFKDMALQILPYELTLAVQKTNAAKETVILVATSGDTGKAALEGFRDVPGVSIIVFYPAEGVSEVQKLQMITTAGMNTAVVAVEGNFDDCQTAVKQVFADSALNQRFASAGKQFSSANSINWGRLLPQIVYYYHGYSQMVAQGAVRAGGKINICVPTGNFGNILAAYYAKRMGLPVANLICASNENKVLADTISTGLYDRRRPFYSTDSPSMDILVSSNFERFFFEMTGRNGAATAQAFGDLRDQGSFSNSLAFEHWKPFLHGGCCNDAEGRACIARMWRENHYLADPHTAVALAVAASYRQHSGDRTPVLTASTASPFKFPEAVLAALGETDIPTDSQALLEKLSSLSGLPVHPALQGLQQKQVRHHRRIEKEEIPATIAEICLGK